jgi:hypothetical protein
MQHQITEEEIALQPLLRGARECAALLPETSPRLRSVRDWRWI